MNAPTPLLEQRLRRGLHAAADALPPTELSRGSRGRASRRRRYALGFGSAAAIILVVAAAVVFTRDGGDDQSDVVAEQPQPTDDTTATTAPPDQAGGEVVPANGDVPGQAVIVGGELHTYGPDGAQTGTVSLAPLTDVQAAASDLDGGWVVCGMGDPSTTPPGADPTQPADVNPTTPTTAGPTAAGTDARVAEEEARVNQEGDATGSAGPASTDGVWWFPAQGEPRRLDISIMCAAEAIHVVDSAEGPTVIYQGMSVTSGAMTETYGAYVLSSGEQRPLDLPLDPSGFYSWTATTGRILLYSDRTGLQMFDLDTGEELPLPPVTIEGEALGDLSISADGTSVAWLAADIVGEQQINIEEFDLVVVDLTTGAERYRETFPISMEGSELSYDGTTVAVGNWYDSYGPITLFDVATPEDRRTLDAHGVIL